MRKFAEQGLATRTPSNSIDRNLSAFLQGAVRTHWVDGLDWFPLLRQAGREMIEVAVFKIEP